MLIGWSASGVSAARAGLAAGPKARRAASSPAMKRRRGGGAAVGLLGLLSFPLVLAEDRLYERRRVLRAVDADGHAVENDVGNVEQRRGVGRGAGVLLGGGAG